MAAHEQQDERVVGVGRALIGGGRHTLGGQGPPAKCVLSTLSGLLAAQQIRQPSGGDRDQPAQRVIGTTVVRPPGGGGGDQRFLGCILRGVEMAIAAHQRTEDPRRQQAQQVLELCVRKWLAQMSSPLRDSAIGRTSITDALAYAGPGHLESSAAISVARSKLSQSMIQ
jgi:hypothetical protein